MDGLRKVDIAVDEAKAWLMRLSQTGDVQSSESPSGVEEPSTSLWNIRRLCSQ